MSPKFLLKYESSFAGLVFLIGIYSAFGGGVWNTAQDLLASSFHFILGKNANTEWIFKEELHPQSLPFPVFDIVKSLRFYEIKEYRLSDGVLKNGELLQRIPEGAWPIKINLKSPIVVLTTSELPLYKYCKKMSANYSPTKNLRELHLVSCSN